MSSLKKQESHFGIQFLGNIEIKKSGTYTFYTTSDDGSMLYVDGQLVVNNDGDHGPMTKSGQIALKKGKYPFRVDYFENIGGELLKVEVEGPDLERSNLSFDILSH